MNLLTYEILDQVAKARSNVQKIKILKDNYNGALYDVLRGTFDDGIVWLLPQGAPPPYTPNLPQSVPSNFVKECAKLVYFVKGGRGDSIHPLKRETMFIQLLESIHPKDAEMLIDVINKKAPRGITRALVEEAFPDLLP